MPDQDDPSRNIILTQSQDVTDVSTGADAGMTCTGTGPVSDSTP